MIQHVSIAGCMGKLGVKIPILRWTARPPEGPNRHPREAQITKGASRHNDKAQCTILGTTGGAKSHPMFQESNKLIQSLEPCNTEPPTTETITETTFDEPTKQMMKDEPRGVYLPERRAVVLQVWQGRPHHERLPYTESKGSPHQDPLGRSHKTAQGMNKHSKTQ